MSEKLIDYRGLRKLIRPDLNMQSRRLIEQRLEAEEAAEAAEAKQIALVMGAPPIPEAQLVYDHTNGTVGVAIRGAKLICKLPKGYEGPALSLAVLPGERIVVLHPNYPVLLLEPATGTTRRL